MEVVKIIDIVLIKNDKLAFDFKVLIRGIKGVIWYSYIKSYYFDSKGYSNKKDIGVYE